MWIKFRHKVVFAVIRPFYRLYLRIKYGFSAKKYKLKKGPYLIIFNHPTNQDAFMVASSFKVPIYFMATDDIFSIKYISPIIKYLVAPIPKSKSFRDIQAIKDTIKVIKEGGTVALSPEGNRTYSGRLAHIDKAIVKLAKHLNVDLVLYNIIGGYGINPRFSTNKNLRHGRMFGQVNKIISADEVQKMSDDELYDTIIQTLTVNDVNLHYKYKGKRLAEHLERIFYRCPVCGELETLHSKGNHFKCTKCNLDVEYTEELKFKSNNKDFKYETVYDWYVAQEEFIRNFKLEDDHEVFHDDMVSLKRYQKNQKKNLLLTGRLSINKYMLKVEDKNQSLVFNLSDITSMTVMGQNKLNFYIDNNIYQIKSNEKFSALKYMHLYFSLKNQKGEQDGQISMGKILGI